MVGPLSLCKSENAPEKAIPAGVEPQQEDRSMNTPRHAPKKTGKKALYILRASADAGADGLFALLADACSLALSHRLYCCNSLHGG